MLKKLYKTNEFAILCGVSKHTLFHYDKIGLLKPVIVCENGYRYYSLDQFDLFSIILLLKKTGSTLEEIKEYISNYNTQSFLEILTQKQLKLNEEIKSMKNLSAFLSLTIATLKEGLSQKIDEIKIVMCEEEYLIATPIPQNEKINDKIIFNTFNEHLNFCKQNNLNTSSHVGEIILKENILNGKFQANYCYSKINKKIKNKCLLKKPKGLYAIFYHQGNYDSLKEVYEKIYNQIKDKGYEVDGNIYEEDLIDYFSENNPEKFILKISLQVK